MIIYMQQTITYFSTVYSTEELNKMFERFELKETLNNIKYIVKYE